MSGTVCGWKGGDTPLPHSPQRLPQARHSERHAPRHRQLERRSIVVTDLLVNFHPHRIPGSQRPAPDVWRSDKALSAAWLPLLSTRVHTHSHAHTQHTTPPPCPRNARLRRVPLDAVPCAPRGSQTAEGRHVRRCPAGQLAVASHRHLRSHDPPWNEHVGVTTRPITRAGCVRVHAGDTHMRRRLVRADSARQRLFLLLRHRHVLHPQRPRHRAVVAAHHSHTTVHRRRRCR